MAYESHRNNFLDLNQASSAGRASGRNTMRLGNEISGLNSLNLRDLMKEQDQDEIKEEFNDDEASERQRQTMGSILGGLISAKEDEEEEKEEAVTRTTLWEFIQSEQSEKPKEITTGRILKNVMRLVARKKDEIRVEQEEFEEEEESSRLLQSWGNNRSPRSPAVVDSARAAIDLERFEEEEGENLDRAVRVFVVGGSNHATDRQMMDRPRWRALRQKLRLRKFACCGSSWSAERSNLSSATPVTLPERDDDYEISWSGSGHRIDPAPQQNDNNSTSAATDDSETCVTAGMEAGEASRTFGTSFNLGASYCSETDGQAESADISTDFGTRFNFSSSYHPERDGQTESAEIRTAFGTRFNFSSSYHPETDRQTEAITTETATTFGASINFSSSYQLERDGQTETVNHVLEQPRPERRQQLITLLNGSFEPTTAHGPEMRVGMNLAAALAAERQLRATQEWEAMPSARVSGVSTLGNRTQNLTEFQTDIETRGLRSPFRVSLLSLLEEPDDRTGATTTTALAPLEEWDSKEDNAVANSGGVDDSLCCVCMVRRKGAAFIPCGHTFCRLCTRELWVSRGSCPLCNRSIMEILDIF